MLALFDQGHEHSKCISVTGVCTNVSDKLAGSFFTFCHTRQKHKLNIGTFIPNCMVAHPKRQQSSQSPPQKPQFSFNIIFKTQVLQGPEFLK